MMLLTFSSYGDVDEKIHVFYDQAFDTLFSRHDSTKEVFRRVRSTDYSIDVFKKILASFCLISYNENKTAFSQSEVLETLTKVVKLDGLQVNGAAFLEDLLSAVCILQKDGLRIVFSHRSFQEYFCAYRLMRFPENKVAELIGRFASRISDNVLPMLFDMDSRLVNRTYIYPMLNRYEKATEQIEQNFKLTEFCRLLGATYFIQHGPYNKNSRLSRLLFISLMSGPIPSSLSEIFEREDMDGNEFLRLRAVVMKLYRNIKYDVNSHDNDDLGSNMYWCDNEDNRSYRETLSQRIKKITKSTKYLLVADCTNIRYIEYDFKKGTKHYPKEIHDIFVSWINRTSVAAQVESEDLQMIKLRAELEQEQKSQIKSLNEILGI
jgi:hypothetical protein